ncbi:MAG: hypothetical protein HY331_16885, partial [Chloroflexi bacterium]|nr:hypothetical protein [Chloroflexota bacterium]
LPIAIAIMLVVGASSATFDTLQQTLMQYAVPEDQRGRAVGVWVLGIGISPVGHLEAGLLTSTIGAPATIITNGVLVVAGALVLASRVPAFRWRPARADLRTG